MGPPFFASVFCKCLTMKATQQPCHSAGTILVIQPCISGDQSALHNLGIQAHHFV